MAAMTQNVISFASNETGDVELAMASLAERGDGLGWVNIGPALTPEQQSRIPEPSVLGSLFSARGPVVPLATWTPASSAGRSRPVVVGVEHGVGPKALDQLKDSGLLLPNGWRKVQDHAKRGIVVELSPAVAHRTVVDWLVRACWALCRIEIDDHWTAVVNVPEP